MFYFFEGVKVWDWGMGQGKVGTCIIDPLHTVYMLVILSCLNQGSSFAILAEGTSLEP